MKKKISITLTALLALSALCTGCSAQSGSSAETTAAETEAVTEAPATEAAETQTASLTRATEAAETEAAETEAATVEASGNQASDDIWNLISGYGFYEGTCAGEDISYSNLSFTFLSDTLEDQGDTWSIEARINQNVVVPADLADGEEVTVTIDELDGTTLTLVRKGTELYNVEDEDDTYYFGQDDGSGNCLLMQNSDDTIDDHFCNGTLTIRKDAICGVAIMDEYDTIEESDLDYDPWFNGVAFNENGEVTALVFFGD